MTTEEIVKELATIGIMPDDLREKFRKCLFKLVSKARNEALEEAARECDDWIQSGPPMSACAKALASEIRALKIGGDSNDA